MTEKHTDASMESTSAVTDQDSLARLPDLRLAQAKFVLATFPNLSREKRHSLENDLLDGIKKNSMAPFYKSLEKDLKMKIDKDLLAKIEKANKEALKEADEKIEDAKENLGESDIREALLAKTELLTKWGMKKEALEASDITMEKTVGVGNRMDLVFNNIRVGLFHMDHSLISAQIAKAKTMIEQGGDWDRRNRLKVYEGLYAMAVRDFPRAAKLFLETVSTFTSYELMDYQEFVTYAVYVSMIALERNELLEKVVKGSEILEVLHDRKDVREYLFSLYECHYGDFFRNLASVEQILKQDRYFFPHYAFYVREMKVKVFAQLLESYRSLTLSYMAEAFNVTEDYMDEELAKFIADGRLHCRIDKVRGIVVTNRPDSKNAQYQATIKQGDILLNRVQKLSRVINI